MQEAKASTMTGPVYVRMTKSSGRASTRSWQNAGEASGLDVNPSQVLRLVIETGLAALETAPGRLRK